MPWAADKHSSEKGNIRKVVKQGNAQVTDLHLPVNGAAYLFINLDNDLLLITDNNRIRNENKPDYSPKAPAHNLHPLFHRNVQEGR
jgi:hypothetical protein